MIQHSRQTANIALASDVLDLSDEELTQTNGGDLDYGDGPHVCTGVGCVLKHIFGSGRDEITPPSY